MIIIILHKMKLKENTFLMTLCDNFVSIFIRLMSVKDDYFIGLV